MTLNGHTTATTATTLLAHRTPDGVAVPALARLWRRLAVIACALAGVATLVGCSAPIPCTQGQSIQCMCTSGATGAKVCQVDESYGACQCDVSHSPDPGLDNDSGYDTSDLDPLGGNTGGDAVLECIRFPTSISGCTTQDSAYPCVTQTSHQAELAIDLGCWLGTSLTNPLPAQARVVKLVTRFSNSAHYDSLADYLAVCGSSANPTDASACNNSITLQTNIGGVVWKVQMLHIQGSHLSLNDVVQPFEAVATCGVVGWTDGPHTHMTMYGGGYHYPGPYLDNTCSGISSPGTCPEGSLCCTPTGEYVGAGQNGPSCEGNCNACNGAGGCTDSCTPACPAGDGLYCGGSPGVNLDSTKLYNCVAGVFTEVQACTDGCHQAPPNNPDYCEPSSMTCPDGNGLYCGITLGLNNDTLYNCQNGNNTVSANCQYGCHVAPPGNPDYCEPPPSGCPSGNGLYCGSNNTLQYCQNGNYSFNSYCSAGCVMAPPGYPDYCASGSCPSGNGLYCGTVSGNLNNNTLYNCQNGAYTIQQVCSQCVVAPPGYADYCG